MKILLKDLKRSDPIAIIIMYMIRHGKPENLLTDLGDGQDYC